MTYSNEPAIQQLVQRALKTSKTPSVTHIFEWGQFHCSKLSLHVLAALAHPSDPGIFWRSDDAFPQIEHVPLNLEALCALASGLILQPRESSDRRRGMALFDLANRRLGGHLEPDHQNLHIMAAHLCGDKAKTRRLLRSHRDCAPGLRNALACLEAHPANGGTTASLDRALRTLTTWDDIRLSGDTGRPTLDDLETDVKPGSRSGPLISVIMTCFRPGPDLLTAVRSIQAQSWKRWELIVVDDASGPEYDRILREVSLMDPRITMLVQPQNGGTYKARNRAVTAADGEFVTGLDSDDWAHPRRLEREVQPMLKNPRIVAVQSRGLTTTSDLMPVVDPQVNVIGTRSTLFMFRTKPIRERIGFYDEVRKNGDSEFVTRIRTEFGPRGVTRVKGQPMTIVRRADDSLSAGETSRAWMSAGRFAYHSGFTHWHQRIQPRSRSAFLDSLPTQRPFPLSVSLTRPGGEFTFEYDRAYAADWRRLGTANTAMIDEAIAAAVDGERVAFVHVPEWLDVNGERALIPESVLKTAAEHGICFTDLRPGVASEVIAPHRAYLDLLLFEHPEMAGSAIRVVGPDEEPGTDPAPVAAGPGRRVLRYRDRALIGLGVPVPVACAAVASSASSLLWIGAGSAAVAVAVAGLALSRQLNRRLQQR